MSMRFKDRETSIEKVKKVELQNRVDSSATFKDATSEFENFFKNDPEEQEKITEKPKKVEILYNAFDNTYCVDGVPYSKIVYNKKDQRETNARLIDYINSNNGIDLLANVKNKKNAIKNLDPTVLAILNSRKGVESCKDYIESVCNSKEERTKEKFDFDIKYDLNGMNVNENLSFGNKMGIIQLASKNSVVAEIDKDVVKPKSEKGKKESFLKKASRIASAFLAGITLAGIGAASNNQKKIDTNVIKQITGKTEVAELETKEIELENKEFKGPNDFRDSIIVKEVEQIKQEKNYILGDVVHLDEGCNYYENSMENGTHNTIDTNNQWRKSGDYMLDGLAVTYKDNEGNWKIAKSIDDESNGGNYGHLGLDSKEYVKKIMQENGLTQDQIRVMYHINMGTEIGKCPTGWIEAPEDGFQVESKYENHQENG